MSGHSKWAQIKRQKGVADEKRSAAFTKLANAVTVAAREGGKDAELNFRLRLAIEKARAANMPKENIERAMKRGTGEIEGRQLENVTYEGFGPDGVAIIAETLTDNRNRTTADLRRVFGEYGGTLGSTNSVLWMFEPRGYLEVASEGKRDVLELALIDAGADNIEDDHDLLIISTPSPSLKNVREAALNAGADVKNAELVLHANTEVSPTSEANREKIHNLLLALEELDDVTNVATNAKL